MIRANCASRKFRSMRYRKTQWNGIGGMKPITNVPSTPHCANSIRPEPLRSDAQRLGYIHTNLYSCINICIKKLFNCISLKNCLHKSQTQNTVRRHICDSQSKASMILIIAFDWLSQMSLRTTFFCCILRFM